jgi:hypothetical protein
LISTGDADKPLRAYFSPFNDDIGPPGHANCGTTEIYTHAGNKELINIKSPLDEFYNGVF